MFVDLEVGLYRVFRSFSGILLKWGLGNIMLLPFYNLSSIHLQTPHNRSQYDSGFSDITGINEEIISMTQQKTFESAHEERSGKTSSTSTPSSSQHHQQQRNQLTASASTNNNGIVSPLILETLCARMSSSSISWKRHILSKSGDVSIPCVMCV